jgi:hypothetical protein
VRRRILMTGVLLAALVLAASGCGGGGGGGGDRLSKSAYEKKVQAEGKKITSAFRALSSSRTNDFDQLAKNVQKGKSELRDAADRLDGVSPPSDIEGAHKDLVAGMRGLADDLEPLVKALKAHDKKKISKVSSDLSKSPSGRKAQKAVNEMKKKGYDVGVLGNS